MIQSRQLARHPAGRFGTAGPGRRWLPKPGTICIAVALAGAALLLAHLAGVSAPATAGGGNLPGMPVATGLFLLGRGRAGRGPRPPWPRGYRTLVVPLAMALLTLLSSLLLWRALDARQQQREQLAAQARRQGVVLALREDAIDEVLAVRRLALRLAAVPEGLRLALFEVDARQDLADIAGLDDLAWVDAHRRLLGWRSRHSPPRQPGLPLDRDAARKLAYDQADASGKPRLSAPLRLASGAYGQLVVVPVEDARGLHGYVVGAIRFDRLFAHVLAPLQGVGTLRIRQDRQLIHARGAVAPGSVPVVASVALYGRQWQVEMYPGPPAPPSPIAWLVWLFGLVLGGVLGVLWRLRALAQERARQAEAASDQLRDQASAREATQAALSDAERNMVTVVESITDGVFMVDRQWRYTYVNPQVARMLGADPASLVGSSLSAFPASVAGESASHCIHELWSQACRDNQPAAMEITLG